MKLRFILISVSSAVLILAHPSPDQAFEIPTHEQLSEVAASRSSLDSYLKSVLTVCFDPECRGFFEGINEPLANGGTALKLIREGSANEDKPDFRSRHHFHNPRLAWNQAGLGWCSLVCESSIVWSQDQNQNIGGKHSWKDARDTYFQALTATSQSDRDRLFAETFSILGHLIHHVQDAATPAHTRDDTHIIRDDLHKWVEKNSKGMIAGIGGSGPGSLSLSAFDTSLLDQANANPFAPVPIARIIDATDGDRGALATGYNIGLAEYSNANFFSDDTIFDPKFLFPSASNLETYPPETDIITGEAKVYVRFTPNSGGQSDYRVARISALKAITNEAVASTDMLLDDAVMNDYAKKLLPRAVSYSKGLIDYFFRNGLFANIWGAVSCSGGFVIETNEDVDFDISHLPAEWFNNFENSTLTDHAGQGTIVFVVHYKHQGQSHYFTLLDTVQTFQVDNEFYPGSDFIASSSIDLSPLAQIPLTATEVYFTVAYRGPLGQETDAVIGGIGYFIPPPC